MKPEPLTKDKIIEVDSGDFVNCKRKGATTVRAVNIDYVKFAVEWLLIKTKYGDEFAKSFGKLNEGKEYTIGFRQAIKGFKKLIRKAFPDIFEDKK